MIKSVVVVLTMLLASQVAAQSGNKRSSQELRPNLDGRWTLSFTKDSNREIVVATDKRVLVVRHQGPEFKILENAGDKHEQELTYYSDGRGEENPFGTSNGAANQNDDPVEKSEKVKSKTKWDGEKLVTRTHLRRVTNGYTSIIKVVKEWRLSTDRNSLTITTRTSISNSYPTYYSTSYPTDDALANKVGVTGREVISRVRSANPNWNMRGPAKGPVVKEAVNARKTTMVYSRDIMQGTK